LRIDLARAVAGEPIHSRLARVRDHLGIGSESQGVPSREAVPLTDPSGNAVGTALVEVPTELLEEACDFLQAYVARLEAEIEDLPAKLEQAQQAHAEAQRQAQDAWAAMVARVKCEVRVEAHTLPAMAAVGPFSLRVRTAGTGGNGHGRSGSTTHPGRSADRSWNRACGSGCHGVARDWDGKSGLSEAQQALLRCQTAAEIVRYARGLLPGALPAGLRRWAEDILAARIDWRRVLAAEIRRALATVSGMVDYSYRKPSRRAAAVQDVILPGFIRPVPEVAVVIDTSGSMDEHLLSQALTEVAGLLRVAGRRTPLLVIPCDAAAHPVQRIRAATQIELLGGGGKQMGQGIAAAGSLRPRPSLVVVTDRWLHPLAGGATARRQGGGRAPARRPTRAGRLGAHRSHRGQMTRPRW
jgi:hypothetical protein